ncbi:Membrane-spanning 4-domains subfamily A member 15 [Fukomys damarensis]|uniref:Membrane-spanning 4-domains subfamily A member 15 n=1 Tax=Fukomys damarensis TaxID=885580 RepID=A0A091E307_FUKDA|nr:Membrane-spanning 4-domains subfamily A member 15 [Fukomys damarensis]
MLMLFSLLEFCIACATAHVATQAINRPKTIVSSLSLDILCMIVTLIAIILTVVELSKFHSVSYKNYGQAPPGAVQLEEPPLGTQTPQATQPPDLRPMEMFLTGEPKALGAVQILIGLIHLGFGSVLLMVRRGPLGMLFIQGGAPFWGGSCFVLSGSLSVAAERSHTRCLVRSSLGTNILSATAAFAGTAILLMDFGVTTWDVGRGYLAVLTIFTILEFFIAVIATHFGCQATRAQANASVIFLPDAFHTDFEVPSLAASPPPAYDNVAYIPKGSPE